MTAWRDATPAERTLALVLVRHAWWLRALMAITVHLPGRAGRVYDRLEEYAGERAIRHLRKRRAGIRK